jgi:uncharacterized protein
MTAQQNPNVLALKQAYRRWRETKGGSADDIVALFDERIEMRSVLAPELPSEIVGPHISRDRAAEYFAGLAREWEMLYYDVYQFVADGEQGEDVVMIGRCAWRHRETGAEVDTPKIDIWHFENGKATRFMEMFDSLAYRPGEGAVTLAEPR